MPWIVGIDEAGYGPNLGPFVMASVACRLPEDHAGADLWHLLRDVVRRHRERDDGRLLIGDSKQVYAAGKGLKHLERGVLATLFAPTGSIGPSLSSWLEQITALELAQLGEECWFRGVTVLPVETDGEELGHVAERFHKVCTRLALQWNVARCVVVCPRRFNALIERWNSKSFVLLLSLVELLNHHAVCLAGEPVEVLVDKHGGRNHYGSLLEEAIPGTRAEAEEESAHRSVYRVTGLKCDLHIRFEPRADRSYFSVALASMLAKYIRELLMLEFNHFWLTHLPNLAPTAGYPGDAARFMDSIRPVAAKLGVTEATLWRQK